MFEKDTFDIGGLKAFATKSSSGKRVISTPLSNNINVGSLSLLPTRPRHLKREADFNKTIYSMFETQTLYTCVYSSLSLVNSEIGPPD